MPARKTDDIAEDKIRIVKWRLKRGYTKKECCDYLGIAYNTKRLEKIIEDFDNKEQREKKLRSDKAKKALTEAEQASIIKDYNNGDSINSISLTHYITAARVKKILLDNNVPIRGRKKKSEGKTEHIVQDLDIKFKKGDKVFVGPYSCYGYVDKVFDEDYLEYLQNGLQKIVYLRNHTREELIKKGAYVEEEREGVDYEIYWVLENGEQIKLSALKYMIKSIETYIEETGREYYRVWVEEKPSNEGYKFFTTLARDKLFPISN